MQKYFLFIIAYLIVISSSIAQNLNNFLIPQPKEVTIQSGFIDQHLGTKVPTTELFKTLDALCSIDYIGNTNIYSSPYATHNILFEINDDIKNKDAYRLHIDSTQISITANSMAGIFYGKQTLQQLITYSRSTQKAIPCLDIYDYPDFEKRGYMLDISRNKVPKMNTLFKIIDLLAQWKINEFQLYTEHTFAYKNHKEVWEGCSPMTPDEIRILDAYCKSKYIDLVPNQNSFGHMENWLRHDKYLPLAECPDDCKTIWGTRKRNSLDPTNPGSLQLMDELYTELLPNFSSQYLNIGCDETVELGCGKTKEVCKEKGKGVVYLEYLKKLNQLANEKGVKAQFWGDIILNHPDLIDEIPSNMTAMVWGYEANYAFNENLPKFKDAGLDYYVCPGTSTWRSLIGRNKNAFENLKNAAINGKKYHAKGFLNTNWGDYGHWQPLSVCYPAMLVGAAYSWNAEADPTTDLSFLLNQYVFEDETRNTGKAVLMLGNAYLKADIPSGNANAFHLMLRRYAWTMNGQYQTKQLKEKNLWAADKEIDDALAILKQGHPKVDSTIVIDELFHAANMAKHGIQLGIARLNAPQKSTENITKNELEALIIDINSIIETHKKLWIIRNREGGLDESVEKLTKLKDYYTESLQK